MAKTKYKIRFFTHLSVETYTNSTKEIMKQKLKKLRSIYGKENVHIIKCKNGECDEL